jgi:hypothetical protein
MLIEQASHWSEWVRFGTTPLIWGAPECWSLCGLKTVMIYISKIVQWINGDLQFHQCHWQGGWAYWASRWGCSHRIKFGGWRYWAWQHLKVLKELYMPISLMIHCSSIRYTVPFQSIQQNMLQITLLPKFSFQHLAEMTVTSVFFFSRGARFFRFLWAFSGLFFHCPNGFGTWLDRYRYICNMICYISAILEGPLHITAELTKMVQ